MISYLLDAIATDLRSHLTLNSNDCDVMPDERPKPGCGLTFIGVIGGQITNPDYNIEPPLLRQEYNVLLSVTVRSSGTPVHSQRRRYIDESTSLHHLLMKIAKRLNGSYATIMADATALLDASDVGGYYTGCLKFVSAPANPTIVDNEWFFADPDSKQKTNSPIHGLHLTAQFGSIRWTQGD